MRVIGGMWRGRTIYPPKGTATRPTTDRIRESLMSSLISARGTMDDTCVLDAFAGSGALGIEALSRGARRATFCEKDRNALVALQRNLDIVGASKNTRPIALIKRGDCLSRPPFSKEEPYDLIFLDPPYALPEIDVLAFLKILWEGDSLRDDALVSYEHSISCSLPDIWGAGGVSWKKIQAKRYGETAIDIFRKDGE